MRIEVNVCLVNNIYLYAFYGFLIYQEYNKTIERCNLLKEERKWEYFGYKSSTLNLYSVLMLLTGFSVAARQPWMVAVRRVTRPTRTNANGNSHQ